MKETYKFEIDVIIDRSLKTYKSDNEGNLTDEILKTHHENVEKLKNLIKEIVENSLKFLFEDSDFNERMDIGDPDIADNFIGKVKILKYFKNH